MILDEIIENKILELANCKMKLSEAEIKSRLRDKEPPLNFVELNKANDGIKIISEIKKASPSKGIIRKDFDYLWIAKEYEDAGAFAISVLTDKKYFQGEINFLSDIRKAVDIPILRKDFTIDPYHIYEARYYGADIILLIVAALEYSQLKEFIDIADSLGMSSIVEAHTESELEVALEVGSEVIGINNRDLKTFNVSLDVCVNLSKLIPEDIIVIGESGISTKQDIEILHKSGIDTFLIGETFMKADSPGEKLKTLLN